MVSPHEPITVSVTVPCDVQQAWQAFTDPSAVTSWNFASSDWHCPHASNDLKVGGGFCYRMEARDGSMGFDFAGSYGEVVPGRRLRFSLGPEREVTVEFLPRGRDTEVRQSFTPEPTHSREQQRAGWQAIMDNYRKYVVSRA